MDRGEDRAEEGEVRAPIMFEERSQVDMLSLVRSVPPRGLSSRGDKLYIISGHVKSDRWCLPSRAAGFEKVVSQPANKLRSGQPRTEWVCRRVMSTTARKKVIGDDVLDS